MYVRHNPDSDVTLVVTSCGRFDLLKRTLDSFFEFNSYPIRSMIITEDSVRPLPDFVFSYIAATWGVNPEYKRGQILSIDDAYRIVDTKYVFHLEDDWEFYRSGFIEESIEALERDPKVINHWLRERNDTNGHPFVGNRMKINYNKIWHGFTFNPTLKRMADYTPYSKLAKFDPKQPWTAEAKIGEYYKNKGYYATIADKGFIKHIG